MPNELKPCPFCGGEAKLVTHSFWNERTQAHTDHTYSVKCSKCFAETYQFYNEKTNAIDIWNRRTDNG